ncbi:MAG: DsrE family protein [Nitriliruptoraceae bacterium]
MADAAHSVQATEAPTERLLFPCSYGPDDPERATVPFIAASTAAVSGYQAVVVCTVEAVRLGLPGVAEQIEEEGMPALGDLVRQLVASDGEIWLCSACAVKRGITGDQPLRDGASIVGAARIVEALATGRSITLT